MTNAVGGAVTDGMFGRGTASAAGALSLQPTARARDRWDVRRDVSHKGAASGALGRALVLYCVFGVFLLVGRKHCVFLCF